MAGGYCNHLVRLRLGGVSSDRSTLVGFCLLIGIGGFTPPATTEYSPLRCYRGHSGTKQEMEGEMGVHSLAYLHQPESETKLNQAGRDAAKFMARRCGSSPQCFATASACADSRARLRMYPSMDRTCAEVRSSEKDGIPSGRKAPPRTICSKILCVDSLA